VALITEIGWKNSLNLKNKLPPYTCLS
jgi:hypothetical protein